MTRINVGIDPQDLCDQHLIAEYKELPRAVGVVIKSPSPANFKLGHGHVAWCAQFQGSLVSRFADLVAEMKHREFAVNFEQPKRDPLNNRLWTDDDAHSAVPILRERIRARMADMESRGNTPKWTRRTRPLWAATNTDNA